MNLSVVGKVITHQALLAARTASHLGQRDLAQQGWLIALEALPRWTPDRGQLASWLAVVVYRGLRDYVRRTSWVVPSLTPEELVEPDTLEAPAGQLDPVDQARLVAGQLELFELLVLEPQAGSARTVRRRRAHARKELAVSLVPYRRD